MGWLWQDFRFGLRAIFKDRSIFFTSVLALALGIGATTAIFSVIDNVLLNPFPYIDSQRIFAIQIHDRAKSGAYARNFFSIPEFIDLQKQNRIFDDSMGVWERTSILGDSTSPESLDTDLVTGNAFQFLGVKPLLGRAILPSDIASGAPSVFVLSYKVWVKRFGLDPGIIGKTFILDNRPTTLIGIMPMRFAFWGGDIWMPAALDRTLPDAASHKFVLYGHLKPRLEPKAAQADVSILFKQLAKIYRQDYPERFDIKLISLVEVASGTIRGTLYLLVGAVSLLLLIACANVANLLLAQAATREKEFALRLALGASRLRLIRQLLVESTLLAFAGAAAGCLFAWFGIKGLLAMLPIFTFPDEAVVGLNNEVLAATVVIAVLTALLFGLAPALAASRRHSNEAIKAGSRGNTGFRRGRLRNAFIVSEVALSLLLLSAAGLLMRSFFAERQIDLGIRTDHLLVTTLNLPKQYKTTVEQARYLRELMPHLESLPGVISAAGSMDFPPNGGIATDFDIPGITHISAWKGLMAPSSAKIFETLGLHLLSGRLLTSDDENSQRRVAVINQTMASHYFGSQNPLGRQVTLAALETAPEPLVNNSFEVVGVISDSKNEGPRQQVAPEAFIPYTIAGFGSYNIFIHTSGDPNSVQSAMTKAVLRMDRSVVPQYTRTMDEILEVSQYARPRFGLILFSVFAGIGLILVTVGVYSVTSYSVTQQRQEIGIRMALGAAASDVRGLFLRTGLRVIATGIVIGLVLATLASRTLASQLWGIPWYDPFTLAGVVTLLTFVGLLASYLPSMRAAQVDPAICLRCE